MFPTVPTVVRNPLEILGAGRSISRATGFANYNGRDNWLQACMAITARCTIYVRTHCQLVVGFAVADLTPFFLET